MTALLRHVAAVAALSATAILGSGCDLLEALENEVDGTTLVQLMVTHHATPEDGRFPDLSDGELRTFETDEGWTVFLQTGYVTTSHATLGNCNGATVDFDPYWGPLPENIGHQDLDLFSFAAAEVESGQYCELSVEYGPFVATPEAAGRTDMGEHRADVEGNTYFFKGVAQKGDVAVDFELSSNAIIDVDLDMSQVMNGGPLHVRADEAFPIDLTLSKTYDRLFDGIDFETAEDEDLEGNIMAMLELETRIAFGTRVSAN